MNEHFKKLADQILDELVRQINFTSKEKAVLIYNYFVENMEYDYELLEKRKNKQPVDLFAESLDVLVNNKGICSSFSEVYKYLLEKENIKSKTVIVDDGNITYHKINLIYDDDYDLWYFADISRGIIYKEEGLDNFYYGQERCEKINQKPLGVFPEQLYDIVFETNKKRKYEKPNEIGLYEMPNNILNEKQSVKKL